MNDIPIYQPIKKPEELDPVARSVAKPSAFAKAGTDKPAKGTRFRPLATKRPPGRPRKHRKDPRNVEFY